MRVDYSWNSPREKDTWSETKGKLTPNVTRTEVYRSDDKGNVLSPDAGDAMDGGGSLPDSATPAPSQRTNKNGITQKGMTLGGINKLFADLSNEARKGGSVMTAGDLPSANSFFSEALPTTEAGEKQGHEGPRVNYSWDSESETDEWDDDKGGLIPPTSKGTTGGKPDDPQDGTSPKPDVADKIRAIRTARNTEGFNGADFSGDYGDEDSYVSPMYSDKDRNAARAAFLDPKNKGYGAIRARDRAVGTFHQYDKGGMNIDGKLYMFKDGMSRDARFERSGGGINSKEDAQAFLNKYVNTVGDTTEKPKTSSETPAQPQSVSESLEMPTTPDVRPSETVASPQTGKPLTVPMNQIPSSSASDAEWKKYYEQLESGKLTG